MESLNSLEQERAKRYKIGSKREEFVLARGYLRNILAAAMDVDPCELTFGESEHGKPYLKSPTFEHSISFNVSHSHGFALIAATLDKQVGVDIEKIRDNIDFTPLAKRFFHACEAEAINALAEADRLGAFFACWARKEALLKAIGKGISFGLNKFEVSVNCGQPAELLAAHWDPIQKDHWWISDLDVSSGYAAAIAAHGKRVKIFLHEPRFPLS